MPTPPRKPRRVRGVDAAKHSNYFSGGVYVGKILLAASVSEGRAQSAAILLAMKSSDFMPAYIAKNRPCTATTASRQNSRLTVANTATTFFSLQPHISK